jgi:hypothetical protein
LCAVFCTSYCPSQVPPAIRHNSPIAILYSSCKSSISPARQSIRPGTAQACLTCLGPLGAASSLRMTLTELSRLLRCCAAALLCCPSKRVASKRIAIVSVLLGLCQPTQPYIYCLLPDVTTQCSGRGRLHRLISPSRSPCPSQVSRRRDGALRLALTSAGPANLVMGAI